MANTFELLASSTVGAGGAANITFSSIPSTYTDLVIKLSGRSSDAATSAGVVMQFNGSGSSLTYRLLEGSGSAAASYNGTTGRIGVTDSAGSTSNTFGNLEAYIPNYAGSTNKSSSTDSVQETNATTAYADLSANLWSNTAAITSIALTLQAGNFVEHTTAYLYGVKNA
jgi:hypothetical protein